MFFLIFFFFVHSLFLSFFLFRSLRWCNVARWIAPQRRTIREKYTKISGWWTDSNLSHVSLEKKRENVTFCEQHSAIGSVNASFLKLTRNLETNNCCDEKSSGVTRKNIFNHVTRCYRGLNTWNQSVSKWAENVYRKNRKMCEKKVYCDCKECLHIILCVLNNSYECLIFIDGN